MVGATQIIEAVILIVIFICCIIGNSMMCLVIFRDKLTRSRTYTLLGNLAIADLGLGICCIPFTTITLITTGGREWILGDALCKVNGFVIAFWIPAVIFSTTCINVHKYLTMHNPFNASRTWKCVKVFVSLTWALSMLCAIGPLAGWSRYAYQPGSTQCGPASSSSKIDLSYMLFLAIFVYVIPLILNVYSFIKVFRAVRKHTMRLTHTAIHTASTGVKRRTAVTFLMVFVSYVVSWTPFFAYGVLKFSGLDDKALSTQYLTVAYIIGFSNTIHNPIIFAFRNRNFRTSFKEIFQAILLRNRRKFRTITNASNFSFQIFKRHSVDISSTWYLSRAADGTVAAEENDAYYISGAGDDDLADICPTDGIYRETTNF
eukprot:gene15699-17282_t